MTCPQRPLRNFISRRQYYVLLVAALSIGLFTLLSVVRAGNAGATSQKTANASLLATSLPVTAPEATIPLIANPTSTDICRAPAQLPAEMSPIEKH